ncbi:MAG TPA: RimK/LysX family protein [Tahibacter sp.]|nr:RimK/LysX family protein [Tahibacter sp.]
MLPLPVIGWREWLALPDLGIAAIKAKVDTGARSSALHVDSLEEFARDGATWLRFAVRPSTARRGPALEVEAPALDRRVVTDSGGHASERWFIRSTVRVAGVALVADINLTSRRTMLFPLLLGRTALAGRFTVDPARSYTAGRRAGFESRRSGMHE